MCCLTLLLFLLAGAMEPAEALPQFSATMTTTATAATLDETIFASFVAMLSAHSIVRASEALRMQTEMAQDIVSPFTSAR